MRSLLKFFGIFCVVGSLAACGGGGGGGAGGAGSVVQVTSQSGGSTTATYNGSSVTIDGTNSGDTTLKVDDGANTARLQNTTTGFDTTFSLDNATSRLNSGSDRFTELKDGSNDRYMVVNRDDGLNYTSFGSWRDGTGANTELGVFYVGDTTSVSNMPSTGTASYTGRHVAFAYDQDTDNFAEIRGNSTFSADFGAGTVSGKLTGNAYDVDNGTLLAAWGSLNIAGTISNNTFSGTVTAADNAGGTYDLTNGASGSVSGAFMGGSAQEVGGTYSVTDGTTNITVEGSFGAKQ